MGASKGGSHNAEFRAEQVVAYFCMGCSLSASHIVGLVLVGEQQQCSSLTDPLGHLLQMADTCTCVQAEQGLPGLHLLKKLSSVRCHGAVVAHG